MCKNLLLVASWVTLLLFSCTPPPEDTTIVNVPVDFTIDLWEDLQDFNVRTFSLLLETTKQYNCENYIIDHIALVDEDQINITLANIIPPTPIDCITANAPASAQIPLRPLSNQTYTINIDLRNTLYNIGVLSIDANHYHIEMEDPKGIEFIRSKLLRIPKNTVWGYITYEADDTRNIIQQFYDDVEQSNAYKPELQKGYYGHFSIDDDKDIQFFVENSIFNDLYIYTHEDKNRIITLAQEYNEIYNNLLHIRLFTSDGEIF